MALKGDDTVTVRQGSAYDDPGAVTSDNATIVSNATNIDTAVPGTYKIHYNATKGCNVLDTVIRTVNVPDILGPAFESATLNRDTGEMTVTFNEIIDISATDLARMYVSDAGEANQIRLAGAAFDGTAPDSDTISITLSQAQMNQIIRMSSPQLDIAAGAVADPAGNAIGNAPDGHILIFLSPAAAGNLEDTEGSGGLLLADVAGVADFAIGASTYAAVASYANDGLQIVDISDPNNPTSAGQLRDDNSTLLAGPNGIGIFTIGAGTYAAVTSWGENGLQIVDISDPNNPTGVGQLRDDNSTLLLDPRDVDVFAIGSKIYAAVTSSFENGLQLVDVTDPASPRPAGSLNDTSELILNAAGGVDTFVMGQKTYAAVTSQSDGLQLVDVTDPDNLTTAGKLQDDNSRLLAGAYRVDVFKLGAHAYAAVAASSDNGLQLVNVTNPDNLTAAGKLRDNGSLLLAGAGHVDTFAVGQNIYAILSSYDDNGIQIVDVTDPDNPRAAGKLRDSNTVLIDGTTSVDTFVIGESTYAAATAGSPGVENGLQLIRLATEPAVQDILELSFASAALDHNTRIMTVTFSKTIDVSATDLARMYVSDAGRTNQIRLAGAAFDNAAPDSDTISMTLSQAQMNRILRMSTPQLDIREGAVSDLDGNAIEASSGNRITVIPVSNRPPVAPAASAETTVNTPVTITPSISDPDKSGTPKISAVDNPPRGTAVFTSTTITYTPDRDFIGRDSFRYTVTDGQDSTQGTVTVTVKNDDVPPNIQSVDLDRRTRTLTITFNESVDASEINLWMLRISAGSSGTASLSSSILASTADSAVVSVILDDGQLAAISALRNPLLEVGAGAVSDLAGNEISETRSLIRITGSLNDNANDNGQPNLSRSGGGGGGGGGGSSGGGGGGGAVPDDFAGLYSVMWDCNEPATTVVLTSDLNAEITLIANSESFKPAADSVQDLGGRTVYTAGAYAGVMLLKVSANDGSSTSKTINTLDRCVGQIEYSRYVPDAPTQIRTAFAQPSEPRPPPERDSAPIPAPAAGQLEELEPDPAEQAAASDPDCGPDQVLRDGECVHSAALAADDGGCLIATAAYGTELAPQVQMLRELRDDTLLSAESGASFVDKFNSAYYAFSPAVADMQRENPAFRDAVKALITPMIHSLSIMSLADGSSEESVLALGVLTIALNLGMYLAAPAAAGMAVARRFRRN